VPRAAPDTRPRPAAGSTPPPGRADRQTGAHARSGLATRGVPGRRRRVVALALVGVLLGGLLAVALPRFIGGGREPEPERATAPVPPERLVMPDLRGLTVAAARTRLQALGAQRPPMVRRQLDGSVAAGRLITTDPPASTQITPHTRITLIVSDGPRPDPAQSDQQRDNDQNKGEEQKDKQGKKNEEKGKKD
jgi:hypothetical protein